MVCDAAPPVSTLATVPGTELPVIPTVAACPDPVYGCGELLTARVAVGVTLVIVKFPADRPARVL